MDITQAQIRDSILLSVKKALGLDPEYDHFDPDIIMFINSAIAILHQLGVGPQETPLQISGNDETWHDLIGDRYNLNMVQTQIYIRVRLMFDPPTSAHVMSAYSEILEQLDWRILVAEEDGLIE